MDKEKYKKLETGVRMFFIGCAACTVVVFVVWLVATIVKVKS